MIVLLYYTIAKGFPCYPYIPMHSFSFKTIVTDRQTDRPDTAHGNYRYMYMSLVV